MPTIDLSNTETTSFDNEQFIQNKAQLDFGALVDKFVLKSSISDSACSTDKKILRRFHNTILINGKRGMGKTSFILSLLENVDKNKKDFLTEKGIYQLGIIDPTLIESKEHVLLNIIALIKGEVTKYHKNSQFNDENCYQQWFESLKNLAGGLSVLEGVGSDCLQDSLWDSPELVLEKGLTNARQGQELERRFHAFIDKSLAFLKNKAFFLVLDDIDTSMKEGRVILEILRKYLTSPKLIVAILGDIDLYSTIVRQLQWEKMDPQKTLLKYEKIDLFSNQIDHLEEQYLTKVLKPENRVNLKSLNELKGEINVRYVIKQEDSKETELTESLEEYMKKLLERVFLEPDHSNYAKLYQKALLSHSLRSVVQVLAGCQKQNNTEFPQYSEILKHTFYSTLKRKLGPFGLLDINESQNLLNLLSLYTLQADINRESHLKFLPEYKSEEQNVSMLYLNTLVNERVKPKDYLSYFIKVGYALERYEAIKDDSSGKNEFIRFVNHIGLESTESNSEISKRLLTTFKVDSNTHRLKPMFSGHLSLSTETDLVKFKDKDEEANLSLLLSRVYNSVGRHYNFLSIFNLIGILADISSSETKDDAIRLLEKNNLIRDFYLYKDASYKEEQGTEISFENSNYDVSDNMKQLLSDWSIKSEKVTQNLNASDLAKIWIRYLYNLNSIDSDARNKKKSYSDILELYSLALLNAAFLQCQEKKGVVVSDQKNPVNDPKVFYNKVEDYSVGDNSEQNPYTFFDYLYELPESHHFFKLPSDLIPATTSNQQDPTGQKSDKSIKNNFLKLNADASLNKQSQKKVIRKVDDWDKKALSTVGIGIRRLGYSRVSNKVLSSLINEMKVEG